jgi:hypothetical protein
MDPNPKKSSDWDSDPDTVVKYKILWTIADQPLKGEKNVPVQGIFQLENFFLCRTDSRTNVKAMRGSESAKKICLSEYEKKLIRIHNTEGSGIYLYLTDGFGMYRNSNPFPGDFLWFRAVKNCHYNYKSIFVQIW